MVVDICIPRGAALVSGSLETCQLGIVGHVEMAYSYQYHVGIGRTWHLRGRCLGVTRRWNHTIIMVVCHLRGWPMKISALVIRIPRIT